MDPKVKLENARRGAKQATLNYRKTGKPQVKPKAPAMEKPMPGQQMQPPAAASPQKPAPGPARPPGAGSVLPAPPPEARRYQGMDPAMAASRYAQFRAGQLPGQLAGRVGVPGMASANGDGLQAPVSPPGFPAPVAEQTIDPMQQSGRPGPGQRPPGPMDFTTGGGLQGQGLAGAFQPPGGGMMPGGPQGLPPEVMQMLMQRFRGGAGMGGPMGPYTPGPQYY